MPGLRIMTYNVRDFSCHRHGVTAVQSVIAEAAPDIVALQEVAAGSGDQLQSLALGLGMRLYIAPGRCGNAFLSYYPLHHLQSFALCEHGCCLRAEIDFAKKRMEIYNVRLEGKSQHPEQVNSLLGDDLLGSRQGGVPALILGDFGIRRRCEINWELLRRLQRISKPLVHGTYPSWLPLLARDRAYVRGDLRVFAAEVVRSRQARIASSHLPLILTVEITDLRKYLQIPTAFPGRNLEIATG